MSHVKKLDSDFLWFVRLCSVIILTWYQRKMKRRFLFSTKNRESPRRRTIYSSWQINQLEKMWRKFFHDPVQHVIEAVLMRWKGKLLIQKVLVMDDFNWRTYSERTKSRNACEVYQDFLLHHGSSWSNIDLSFNFDTRWFEWKWGISAS